MLAALIPIVLAAAPPAAGAGEPTVAVVELTGLVADADRLALDDQLRALVPGFDVELQLKERTQKAQRDLHHLGLCADAGSVECLVQVGALSKANVVLAGVVSSANGGVELALAGVDVNGMKERGRVKVLVPAVDVAGDVEGGAARTLALQSALTAILRPEAWQGTLKLSVAQRGASIYVDGIPRGIAPLADAIALTPGPHAVFVSLEGFAAFKQTIDVSYARERDVEVVLVPGVTEPPPRFAAPLAPAAPAGAGTQVARKSPLRVVMYDVDAVGVDPRVARVMGQLLVDEMRKRERVSVLDSAELHSVVGAASSTAGDARHCSAAECFAEVADALGADVVVVAQLTDIEGQILFGLRRVDAHKQEVAASFLERVPAADTGALLPLVGKSIAAVFADVPLRAGQRAGVDERAGRVMNPPPLPPLLAGSLYAGAGVSAAASAALLGTAGVLWLDYGARSASFQAATGTREQRDENGALAPEAQAWATSTTAGVVALGAAAVLGVAAVATGFFTDWDGYGAAAGAP